MDVENVTEYIVKCIVLETPTIQSLQPNVITAEIQPIIDQLATLRTEQMVWNNLILTELTEMKTQQNHQNNAINAILSQLSEVKTQLVQQAVSIDALKAHCGMLSDKLDHMNVMLLNSQAEALDDAIVHPVAVGTHADLPAYMPSTVRELLNLQAGAELAAIENYLGLTPAANLGERVRNVSRGYGVRRLVLI
jgi:hypothetical protein